MPPGQASPEQTAGGRPGVANDVYSRRRLLSEPVRPIGLSRPCAGAAADAPSPTGSWACDGPLASAAAAPLIPACGCQREQPQQPGHPMRTVQKTLLMTCLTALWPQAFASFIGGQAAGATGGLFQAYFACRNSTATVAAPGARVLADVVRQPCALVGQYRGQFRQAGGWALAGAGEIPCKTCRHPVAGPSSAIGPVLVMAMP